MVITQLKKLKKTPMFNHALANDLNRVIEQSDIKKVIPHREPFLLIDEIVHLNLEQRILQTTRTIAAEDPVFKGHFPNNPIYPGVLQQEIMFQSALALLHFIVNQTTHIDSTVTPCDAVGTRLYDMYNIEAVRPKDQLTIRCHIEQFDSLIVTAIGQISVGDKIVSTGKGEMYVG